MASVKRASKTKDDGKANSEELLQVALTQARSALEADGVIASTKMGPPALRPQITKLLVEDGFEKTAKGVRLALATQVDALVQSGQQLPVARFASLLHGATATEATKERQRVVREGKMALVLRDKQLTLVPNSERVVGRRALKPLADALKVAQAWLAKANADKSGATVLLADITEAFADMTRLASAAAESKSQPKMSPSKAAGNSGAKQIQDVLRGAMLALQDEDTALASVPAISRNLRTTLTPDAVIDGLMAGFRAGQFELRPEGGIGRLSPEDVTLCPKGAGGVPLSWVRLVEGQR